MELLDLKEEKALRKQLTNEAAAKCSDEKAKFGQCVASTTFPNVFCRKELATWNTCLKK